MKQMEYWAGWMQGWAAATKAMLEAQQAALHGAGALAEAAGDLPQRMMAEAAGAMRLAAPPAMAGSHPGPRRRGRPPKAQAVSPLQPPQKRRRGRPPKNRTV